MEAVPFDGTNPVQNYRMIRNELAQYSPALAEQTELLVLTKMDIADSAIVRADLELSSTGTCWRFRQ